MDSIKGKHDLDINLSNALMLMLVERLQQPSSKRQNYLNQQEYLGIESIDLHHLYRTLDYLSMYSDQVQSFHLSTFP